MTVLGLLPASPQISRRRGSARMWPAVSTGSCAGQKGLTGFGVLGDTPALSLHTEENQYN